MESNQNCYLGFACVLCIIIFVVMYYSMICVDYHLFIYLPTDDGTFRLFPGLTLNLRLLCILTRRSLHEPMLSILGKYLGVGSLSYIVDICEMIWSVFMV